MFPSQQWKISKKWIKHADTVVRSIQYFTLAVAKALSNPQNNPRPKVDCYRTNSFKYYCAYQDLLSDQISRSYHCTTLYPTY